MTLIEMAKKAGFETKRDIVFVDDIVINKALERFAALVAEKEREACAKVCIDDKALAQEWMGNSRPGEYYARKIIERGQK